MPLLQRDILMWPDGRWCFRHELETVAKPDDYGYRTIKFRCVEWYEIGEKEDLKLQQLQH